MKTFDIEQTQEIGSMARDFDPSPLSSVNLTRSLSQNSSFNGVSWSLPFSGPIACSISSPEPSGRDNDTQMLQDMMAGSATTADDTDMLGEPIPFVLDGLVL